MQLIHDDESRMQLKCAARVAGESPDPSTQNGAVIVTKSGRVIISGCNHPVIDVDVSTLSRDEKYSIVEHAERSVIYRCAETGVITKDATMFCLWAVCAPCARAVIRSGIKRLVTLESLYKLTPERWKDDVVNGLHLLAHAGVAVDFYEGALGERILFDGREVEI